MPISKSKHMANEKYNAKAYDEIKVRVSKGHKAAIQSAAEGNGESVNGFINRLVNAEMERLKKKADADKAIIQSAEQEAPKVKVSVKLEAAEVARRMLREQLEAERKKEMMY